VQTSRWRTQDLVEEFSAYAAAQPKVSSHCHQLPERQLVGFDLEALLRNSYINWCGLDWGPTEAQRAAFFAELGTNSYLVWLRRGLTELYPGCAPLSAASWAEWDARLRAAYRDGGHAREVLTEKCGYRRMLLDAYWQPGSDNDAPALFAPSYRVNAFFFGYSRAAGDHDGNNPYALETHPFLRDLDEYEAWLRASIRARRAAGCVALKLPIAYDRGLDFQPVDDDQARRAFARLTASPGAAEAPGPGQAPSNAPQRPGAPAGVDPQDVRAFQDALFFRLCAIAAEFDLPLQIHTGSGQGRRTNAARLQDAIERCPTTRFVLLHCGYPWIQELGFLVEKYPNVYPDLSLLPLVSTRGCVTALHDLLERSSLGRLAWGCDTWTPEESCGALLAFRQCLATALAEKVVEGYFSRPEAERVITAILWNNPRRIYSL